MRSPSIVALSALVASTTIFVGGCNQGPADATSSDSTTAGAHNHAHAEEGPHGGHIIELGADNHHAELTHDEASHLVGVYILDGAAKELAPIESESVTINVALDGEPTQYILPAVAQEGEGGASYFEIVSEPLCKIVCGESEAETTTARVSITINGKPYIGIIETDPHEHDHGHGHAH
jgi:hypothetical protein